MEIRAVQVTLDILIGIANLFLQEGKRERALELLAYVTHQAKSGQERKDRALALIPECEAGLSPQEVARRRKRGQSQTLTEIVAVVMDE